MYGLQLKIHVNKCAVGAADHEHNAVGKKQHAENQLCRTVFKFLRPGADFHRALLQYAAAQDTAGRQEKGPVSYQLLHRKTGRRIHPGKEHALQILQRKDVYKRQPAAPEAIKICSGP